MINKAKSLAVLAAIGVMATGCEDSTWYDNWYTETPAVQAPDPSYDSSLTFETAYLEAAFLGCFNNVDDADFIKSFGYNPAAMPANFWLWYGYAEFLGVAGSGGMTVQWDTPDGPMQAGSIYTEFGGAHGASFGEFASGEGACDGYALPGTTDGDFLFCDYFYADNMYAVDDCDVALPPRFHMVISVADLSDSSVVASGVVTEENAVVPPL